MHDKCQTTLDVQYDAQRGQIAPDGQWSESPKQQTSGDGQWKLLVFEMPKPRFANGQNGGTDLRIRSSDKATLEIRSVRLCRGKPSLVQ